MYMPNLLSPKSLYNSLDVEHLISLHCLRQEAHGFLENASCMTIPKSQWLNLRENLNPRYIHLLLMSQPNVVNTQGALFYPVPCGSRHLLSGGSAIHQDLSRTIYWAFCFQLAQRESD